MQIRHRIALLGAITAAIAAPAAAFGASGSSVSVRVEGKSKTLLPATVVHPRAGWITKGGAPKGACSTRSAAGALDAATHHRWRGAYEKTYSDYLIGSIIGEKYGSKAKFYWEIFVNGVPATTGACGVKTHAGDQILFAAASLADYGYYPIVVTGAPRSARAGHAFKVKVVYVNALGKKVALSGARLAGADFTPVQSTSTGAATITPAKSGILKLVATHAATQTGQRYGYVRSASLTLHVAP